ncbi:MAG: putative Phosphoenolpyruvate synthase [Nitrospira sp.]|jgi:pyruvate,water dikinase|nr:putative Phosphoenolpyruvate synthase [Nitrospira sp.]
MPAPLILPLKESIDPRLVGGKAAGLSKLLAAGFAVPQGFCITTATYRRCLEEAGIDVAAIWDQGLGSSEAQRVQQRERIQRLLLKQPWPGDLPAKVADHLAGLQPAASHRWAVRSSATNEDTATVSAAGLYHTALGQSSQDILAAIRDCWMSLWDKPAFQYGTRLGSSSACPEMAVVIQPMLNAKVAGVAYSMNPLTGRTSQVTINALPGLASSVVSGEVTPDQYVVEVGEGVRPPRVRRRLLAQKRQKLIATAAGMQKAPIPDLEQQRSSLSDEQLFELARLSKQVESAFGYPVDLEWVWDAERLWIVQARPITAVRPSRTLTNDECEWTRANLKETLPELPSPLGLSFLERFMDTYMITPYRHLGCTIPEGLSAVRVLHGRPYLNVTLFYTLIVQLHGDPALLSEQMGGEPITFTPDVRPLGLLALAHAVFAMMREWRKVAIHGPQSFVDMKRMADSYHPDRIQHLSALELGATLDAMGGWLDEHEFTFGILGGVAQSFQALGMFLPGWLGPDWRVLLNASLQGKGTVISAYQIVRLAELAEIAQREEAAQRWFLSDPWTANGFREALAGTEFLRLFECYLIDYGHRAVGESDIMSPRIADQPEAILVMLQTQVRSGQAASPRDIVARQIERSEEALAEIKRRFGWRRYRWIMFHWWYRRLCRYCALREANRHHLMYYSAGARHLLLRLGERMVEQGILAVREDVFYLTLEERTALVKESSRDWQRLVRERREEHIRNQAREVPDTVRDWHEAITQDAHSNAVETNGLHGIPISCGSADGPVRVVRSTADWNRVQAGDILVVPVIDPGLAPLFGLAAGLVAEMGGTLSHGAIIAREYGLPALVNVPFATSLLRENEQVRIDSSTGMVRRSVA